jgi:hypothetical protein
VTTYFDRLADKIDVVECDDTLKEIKQRIASFRVREVSDSRGPWPRNDGREKDSNEDRAADPIKHKDSCENPTGVIRKRLQGNA